MHASNQKKDKLDQFLSWRGMTELGACVRKIARQMQRLEALGFGMSAVMFTPDNFTHQTPRVTRLVNYDGPFDSSTRRMHAKQSIDPNTMQQILYDVREMTNRGVMRSDNQFRKEYPFVISNYPSCRPPAYDRQPRTKTSDEDNSCDADTTQRGAASSETQSTTECSFEDLTPDDWREENSAQQNTLPNNAPDSALDALPSYNNLSIPPGDLCEDPRDPMMKTAAELLHICNRLVWNMKSTP